MKKLTMFAALLCALMFSATVRAECAAAQNGQSVTGCAPELIEVVADLQVRRSPGRQAILFSVVDGDGSMRLRFVRLRNQRSKTK